jgi:hypothetical protein
MVVVAMAAEIINVGMIWRSLFAFMGALKPCGISSVGATLTSFLRIADNSLETEIMKRRYGLVAAA